MVEEDSVVIVEQVDERSISTHSTHIGVFRKLD
jgi:hypothetical protein